MIKVQISTKVLDNDNEAFEDVQVVKVPENLLTGVGDHTAAQDQAAKAVPSSAFWEWYHRFYGRSNAWQ